MKSRDLLTEAAGGTESPVDGGLRTGVTLPAFLDSRRRFTVAVIVGMAVAAVPYLWVLLDLWTNSPNLFRTAESDGYASNFYDLQARAMFHGHLYVANGALPGEAFVHAGRQYTYFGLFPSLLRMPFFLFTHSLDGRLTAPSMLLAWMVTGIFTSLMVWRIRHLVRGSAALSWGEAAAYGVLVATVLAGSVLVFLASDPWVFSEDLAWSVALTIGSMFALLGVLERPTWAGIIASGLLILAANLNRATTGYACVIGAGLVAVWFALGYGGSANRHWALPVLIAGVVPLAAGCAVDYAKFGIIFGLPASGQIVYQYFGLNRLAGGSYFGIHFLPSTLLAYFQPPGVRLTSVFPFVTLPASPAHSAGRVFLYGSDRTTSVTGSMPLLFLLSLWGGISAFRPRPPGRSTLLRLVLLAALAGGCTIMIYGWIENRFLADFMPFLTIASAVGLVDVWRRLEHGRRRLRYILAALVAVLGLYGIAANVAMASTPQHTWSIQQRLRFVETQKSISDVTGHPLDANVVRGKTLPNYAPADQLFVVNNSASLYISEGQNPPRDLRLPPNFVLQSNEWLPVELGPGVVHTLDIIFHGGVSQLGLGLPLVTFGTRSPTAVMVEPDGVHDIRFVLKGPYGSTTGSPVPVKGSQVYRFSIITDQNLDSVSVASGRGTPSQWLYIEPRSGYRPHPAIRTRQVSVGHNREERDGICAKHVLVSEPVPMNLNEPTTADTASY